MKNWILRKWDWWIYRRAFHSFRRLCESNQGFAYLFELHLRDYRAAHPIPEMLEKETESFYAALRTAVSRARHQTRTNQELNAAQEALRSYEEAMYRTIDENRHLADGEDCTLIHLKRALRPNA